jgi:hypothetical protein
MFYCLQKFPTQKLIKLSLPLPIKFAPIKKERINNLPQKTEAPHEKKERKRVSSNRKIGFKKEKKPKK